MFCEYMTGGIYCALPPPPQHTHTRKQSCLSLEDDVNSAWAGLGYYRRARFLHEGAKSVVKNHGGVLPTSAKGLLKVHNSARNVSETAAVFCKLVGI
jgi:hypothetical protein